MTALHGVAGIHAYDAVDGDLGAKVEAVPYPWTVSTASATPEGDPYTILYTVGDLSGNAAEPILAEVRVDCPKGEQKCPPGANGWAAACTADLGLCSWADSQQQASGTQTAAVAAPPKLELLGNKEVTITAGTPYTACDPNTPPGVICERGGIATDAYGAPLTGMIEVGNTRW